MEFITFGINHKTAPIEIREKFFLNSIQQDLLLSELRCNPCVLEAFVLSTCNRTEIHAHVLDKQDHFAYLIRLLCDIKHLPVQEGLEKLFYFYTDREAIRHLLQVAAGLDSLVLGEKQILGQVKAAVEKAQARGLFSRYFNILGNIAVRTGKMAHHGTDISYGGSSVSWAAMMMAEQKLGTLAGKSLLMIGAGKMGELTLKQIENKHFQQIFLMNRTCSAAMNLADKYAGTAVSFADIRQTLAQVDVCICAVSAPHYIIERELVETMMDQRPRRPLVIIDISMPRNVAPDVGNIKNVALSCIDDLEQVVEETMRIRQEAIGQVERIIERKIQHFYQKIAKAEEFSPAAG